MKKFLFACALALVPSLAFAASPLDWAYPVAPTNLPKPDPKKTYTADGAPAGMKLTMKQIGDAFGPPDWFPKEHGPMPDIVRHGRQPHVRACILCHLPSGNGHPESASVSGLTVPYIIDQMHAFRDGTRNNIRAPAMIEMAKDIKESELKQAAQYFAAIKPAQQKGFRAIESKTVPMNHVGGGGARFFDKDSKATLPIGPMMIYEVAESDQVELRNPHVGFVDYVPQGSIEKGRIVALGNHGKMKGCASCHGDDYKGHEDVPRLAGRGAYYLIRQLNDMKIGARKGPALGKMKEIIGKLSDQDIVNVVAFMASRSP